MPKQIQIERFAVDFALAAKQPNESGRFKGIASVFGSIVDTTMMLGVRTRFRPGAFAKTIADRQQRVKILSAHDDGAVPIGLPVSLAETSEGLEIVASLNNTTLGRDWAEYIRHAKELGLLSHVELSIGFDAVNSEMVEDETDGEQLREVTEARLWEVSLVSAGADRKTHLTEAASLNQMLHGTADFEAHRARALREIEQHEIALGLAPKPWSCLQ